MRIVLKSQQLPRVLRRVVARPAVTWRPGTDASVNEQAEYLVKENGRDPLIPVRDHAFHGCRG